MIKTMPKLILQLRQSSNDDLNTQLPLISKSYIPHLNMNLFHQQLSKLQANQHVKKEMHHKQENLHHKSFEIFQLVSVNQQIRIFLQKQDLEKSMVVEQGKHFKQSQLPLKQYSKRKNTSKISSNLFFDKISRTYILLGQQNEQDKGLPLQIIKVHFKRDQYNYISTF